MTPVEIANTDSFTLEAPGTSGRLRIDIAHPLAEPAAGLLASDTPLPLVVVLDGNLSFPIAAVTGRMLQLGGEVPAHMMVGISYHDGASLVQFTKRRFFDFSDETSEYPSEIPFRDELRAGGRAAFLSFLIEGLLPELDQRYAIDPNRRYLLGASLAGWFTGQALLADRGRTFAGYGLLSAAFCLGDRALLDSLKGLGRGDLATGTRLFLCVGSEEERGARAPLRLVSDARSLMETWSQTQSECHSVVLDGETHESVFGPAYTRALRHFLAPAAQTAS